MTTISTDASEQIKNTANIDRPPAAWAHTQTKPGSSTRRVSAVTAGVVLIGIGAGAAVAAELGMPPYDAVALQIASNTGIPSAVVFNVAAALVLVVAMIGGQRPGAGTVARLMAVGPLLQLSAEAIGNGHSPTTRTVLLTMGTIAMLGGSSLMVASRAGAGAYDLLTLSLVRRRLFGKTVSLTGSRGMLEMSLVVVSLTVGGPLGLGTIAMAVVAGPALRAWIPLSVHLVDGKEAADRARQHYRNQPKRNRFASVVQRWGTSNSRTASDDTLS